MAQSDRPPPEPVLTAENVSKSSDSSLWRRLFGRESAASGIPDSPTKEPDSQSGARDDPRPGLIRRVSRKVVPGLPRAQTFKRQQSEVRNNLEPVQPTPAERRAVSVDRRLHTSQNGSQTYSNPRSSAPDFNNHSFSIAPFAPCFPSVPVNPLDEKLVERAEDTFPPLDEPLFHDDLRGGDDHSHIPDPMSTADCHSVTTSQYDALIHDELERTWILNLSMHFRDKSKREKFFVTYREQPTLWRRVTISVDYRNAPHNSLELELAHIKYQRDKIAKIYDAIRESLVDIQFYPTVTNLKLQTTEGRLHVHVVEDVNEIIHYPSIRTIQHMRCSRVKERDIEFDSHISGFVYKVRVNDQVLIKKEIPGPDTVDEFLYEINALNRLRHSNHVIRFHGVIVDDNGEFVKGLLISHAEQGALIDIIYDQIHPLPWSTRERWARQIVAGLSEIHEAGFVQGDFTLSNIVVDDDDNAKIIDINRRGCPVGWEPPEATPLIESNQRISMYIGVKSDLYQLGMVLWSLAMKEDEPEAHGRPLRIGSDVLDVPDWFRRVVDICLSDDPRGRLPALQLLSFFPDPDRESDVAGLYDRPSISVDDGVTRREYFVDADPTTNGYPRVRTVQPASDWSYVGWGHSHVNSPNGLGDEPFFYPTRGRSPPSPLPSNPGEYDSARHECRTGVWASTTGSARTAPSESDTSAEEKADERKQVAPPRKSHLSAADALNISFGDEGQGIKPANVQPTEQTAITSVPEPDEMVETQKPEESQLAEGRQTAQQQQVADLGIRNPLSGPTGGSEEPKIRNMESFVVKTVVQDMKDKARGSEETGYTEPVMMEDDSKPASTQEARAWDSKSGEEATPTDGSHTGKPMDEVKRTATVSTPQSHSDGTVGAVQEAATEGTMEEATEKIDTAAGMGVADQPSSTTSGHPAIPDDLKGVGSTYDTGPGNWHQSMTNQDIAELIDAEMAADTKNDSIDINDTAVTNPTNI